MRRPEGLDFETRDPEVAHAQITEAYAEHRATLLGNTQDFLYRHHRIDMGGVRIDTFRSSPTVEYDVDSLPYAMACRVRSGLVTSTTEGVERVVGPGGVFLVVRPLGHYVTRMDNAEIEVVGVDERIFARIDPAAVARLEHLSVDPLDCPGARAWSRAIDYVTRTASDELAGGSPLVLSQAGRLVAATMLAVFDRAADSGTEAEVRVATPDTLRRAIDVIESEPGADIGLADLAAACHVTPRAPQLAFRRHLDTTPMAYLRTARLRRLHDELRGADPAEGATVTEAAARWGFTQLGRLSTQYRALFGESPRDTLRRR